MVNEGDPRIKTGGQIGESTPDVTQQRARRYSRELAEKLIDEGRGPDIAGMYRQTIQPEQPVRRLIDIAQLEIPEVAETYPKVAVVTISRVIAVSMPVEERRAITSELHRLNGEQTLRELTPKEKKDFHSAGGKKRAKLLKEGKIPIPVVRGSWFPDEVQLLELLAKSQEFQHRNPGSHLGHPDWAKIANFLNRMAHKGETVRNAVGTQVFYRKHQAKTKSQK